MYSRILLFAFYRESAYQMSVFRKMNMFTLCVAKGFMFISCTVPYIRTVNKVRYLTSGTHRVTVEFSVSVTFFFLKQENTFFFLVEHQRTPAGAR
jgi:hypothetical protein